jgi:hypothetical protein
MHVRRLNNCLSLAAVLACAAGTANAQVFSVSPALPIPAGAPATTTGNMDPSVLTVSGGPASIGQMRFTFDISHSWNADVDMVLVNPAGDRFLKLTTDNGGGGDNFVGTVLVDTATASITTIPGTGNISGEWRAEGGEFVAVTDPWLGANALPATALSGFSGFAGSSANGDWTLFIYDDAGGDVGTLNSWSIEFVNPTLLGGTGSATAANVCPTTGSTLITVQAFPAAGPPSTGITGRVDLSSVGGSATQALFDNGTNGDVTAGDNIFSYRHTMPSTQSTGPQSVTWTLSDAQNRTATGNATFAITCSDFSDLCSDATTARGPGTYAFELAGAGNEVGNGSCAAFSTAQPDRYMRYRATRTGEARITTCGVATFDSLIEVYDTCGGPSIACNDDSPEDCGGAFSLQSEIFLQVVENQEYLIRITAYGASGAAGTGSVLIEEGGSRLTMELAVSPDPVPTCEPLLITATVVPGQDPASTNITVLADLSDFNGGIDVPMFDDGTNGDATAGDNVWSLAVDAPDTVGFWFIDCTVTDAEGRTATETAFFDTSAGACTLAITDAVATPEEVTEGQPALFTVTVSPATDPVSTNVQVTGDFSEIGGPTSQQFFDDGTNGDLAAGDNVYSFTFTPAQPDAFAFVDVFVTDGEGRADEDFIFVEVLATPAGACCIGEGCTIVRQAQCAAQGGSFGGAGTDCGSFTYESAPSTSAFESIGTTGTSLGLLGDDVGGTITLPFPFRYSGTNFTEVYANSNGLLVFGGVSNSFFNEPFPTAAVPNNIISALWDDYEIDALVNPTGNVYFQEFGAAPNRTFVISWEKLTQLNRDPADSNNFQIVFTEGSNNLIFRYGVITEGIDANAGLENATGSQGLAIDVASIGAGDVSFAINAVTETPAQCSGSGGCNSIDFNGDTLFPSDEDLIDFLSVLAGGPCSTNNCGSIDFNNDGLFPADEDLISFLRVLAGGEC